MQFGIAAGQEDGIGRSSSGDSSASGEKKLSLGAGGVPVGEPVGIEEGEGVVAGDGDALAEGRKAGAAIRPPQPLPARGRAAAMSARSTG